MRGRGPAALNYVFIGEKAAHKRTRPDARQEQRWYQGWYDGAAYIYWREGSTEKNSPGCALGAAGAGTNGGTMERATKRPFNKKRLGYWMATGIGAFSNDRAIATGIGAFSNDRATVLFVWAKRNFIFVDQTGWTSKFVGVFFMHR